MSQKIIGIVLVRNEERFLEQVVRNILNFCDQLLLVDHHSSDGTLSIFQHLHQEHPAKISLHQIESPSESQKLLEPWIGTKTWVFGVDGDELYDPERLIHFRKEILAGKFDQEWMVLGNVLHVDHLFEEGNEFLKEDGNFQKASGYLAPPSRSITKLYNFAAIEAWPGKTLERLHGGEPRFKPGFHAQKKRLLQYEYSWEESPLRCLHLCFLKRSHVELATDRQNIMEIDAGRGIGYWKKIIRVLLGRPKPASWKQQHYQRGGRCTHETTAFFNTKK